MAALPLSSLALWLGTLAMVFECSDSADGVRAVYEIMSKPAYVFDSRGTFEQKLLHDIGFVVYRLGKSNLR